MNKFYVYTITSSDTGEVLYVGKGSGYRWKKSLSRIESLHGNSCEVFIQDYSSEQLALKDETNLISSLAPVYNKKVSWRKVKESEGMIRELAFRVSFDLELKTDTKIHGGFKYELIQVEHSKFRILITKLGSGCKTFEFKISTARYGELHVAAPATGVIEPSIDDWCEHSKIYVYFKSALASLQNVLNVFGYSVRFSTAIWTNIKFNINSTTSIKTDGILEYFICICGRVERARGIALGVAQSLGFKFKEYKTANRQGIKFYRQVNESTIFSIALYALLPDKTKMSLETTLSSTIFYRGKARRFKDIFLGENLERMGKGADTDIQRYFSSVEFLQDSEATTDTLRMCLKEMADQIGLPIIFGARHPAEVRRFVESMEASEEERRILDSWLANEVPAKESNVSSTKFYKIVNGLTDRLGFRILDVPFDAFVWIRMSLLQSMFTREEHRELNLLNISGDKKNRIAELRAEASSRADATLSSMKLTAKSLAVLGSK